jgi:DNA-binding CsgD family transcriptional regulator
VHSQDLSGALLAAVETLEDGLCVARRGGDVLYQNAAFRAFLAGPEARTLKETIKDARRAALGRADNGGRHPANVNVETHTGVIHYRVRCSVVRPSNARLRGETIVVWVRPLTSPGLSSAELRRRYGVTPREGRVARLLESGARTREIAQALGISIHTARRHSEAVLRKLGVHSRMEVRERLQSSSD